MESKWDAEVIKRVARFWMPYTVAERYEFTLWHVSYHTAQSESIEAFYGDAGLLLDGVHRIPVRWAIKKTPPPNKYFVPPLLSNMVIRSVASIDELPMPNLFYYENTEAVAEWHMTSLEPFLTLVPNNYQSKRAMLEIEPQKDGWLGYRIVGNDWHWLSPQETCLTVRRTTAPFQFRPGMLLALRYLDLLKTRTPIIMRVFERHTPLGKLPILHMYWTRGYRKPTPTGLYIVGFPSS